MQAQKTIPSLDWSSELVRDPIWEDIRISKWERQLMHTPAFNRIRHVLQLGFVYLSYTGANHSRFEHCVGTMEAADRLFHMINFDESAEPFKTFSRGLALGGGARPADYRAHLHVSQFRQALRLCGLLHDVGHPPYSHTCEHMLEENGDLLTLMAEEIDGEVWQKWPEEGSNDRDIKNHFKEDCQTLQTILDRQEKKGDEQILGKHATYTKFLVLSPRHGIRRVIENWAKKDWGRMSKDELQHFVETIAWLAAGEYPPMEPNAHTRHLTAIPCFISGDLDVDKIDYIARDNYHCGLPYERDWTGISKQVYVEKQDEGGEYNLTFGSDAMFFLKALIYERYRFAYHVHDETWNSYLDRDIGRKLRIFLDFYRHNVYRPPYDKLTKKILDLYTLWQDADLRWYLEDTDSRILHSGSDDTWWGQHRRTWGHQFEQLMTKTVSIAKSDEKNQRHEITTVRDDARIHLGFDQMSPPVRKMVHVLSQSEMRTNPEAKRLLDRIEYRLNQKGQKTDKPDSDFVLQFYKIPPIKFVAELHDQNLRTAGPRKILDNQIIRGIMNESLKQFGVCVLGSRDIDVPTDYVPESCIHCQMYIQQQEKRRDEPFFRLCVKGATPQERVLLNEIISCYRKLCKDICAKRGKIVYSDFLLKVLGEYENLCDHPDPRIAANFLCHICHEVGLALSRNRDPSLGAPDLPAIIFGKAKFSTGAEPVPFEFHQELRACVYMGLVDAVRDIAAVSDPGKEFVRYNPFQRTYRLSVWGRRYFVAINAHCADKTEDGLYGEYASLLDSVTHIFQAERPGKGVTRKHYLVASKKIKAISSEWDRQHYSNVGQYEEALKRIPSR